MKKLFRISLFLMLVCVFWPVAKAIAQPAFVEMYLDLDGDTYWGKRTTAELNSPRYNELLASGYLPFADQNANFRLTRDCNDANPNVWEQVKLWVDKDGDKYTIGYVIDCIGATVPAGFIRTNEKLGSTDCDDSDPAVFQRIRIFKDADGDKWSVEEGIVTCIGDEAPAGFVKVFDVIGFYDCDDNDPNVNAGCSPLPVGLIDLKASEQGQTVVLNWKTLNEENNAGFEVQRSSDAGNWQYAGYVKGAGNSNQQVAYSFIDPKPFGGVVFYRLKQLDLDGRFAYSVVVNTRVISPGLLTISPNPATHFVEINGLEKAQVKVMDVNGRTLISQAVNGNTNVNVSGLTQGVYFFEITTGEGKVIRKVLKR